MKPYVLECLREEAALLREWGASAHAQVLEHALDRLEEALAVQDDVTLNLQEAAAESGYSAEHLGRLVREAKLPNAGRPNAPRIRRCDLPRKPTKTLSPEAFPSHIRGTSQERIARHIATHGG
jgi:hypothetical protein